jgi:aminopeptidase N
MRWTPISALCLVWVVTGFPLSASLPERLYTVENYDVSVQIDLAKQQLAGEVNIRIHSRADFPVSALEFDAGGMQITSVLEGQSPQWFERNRGMLYVTLTNPIRSNEQRTIDIRYEAGPAPGLKFFPDQIFTYVTSDWMPCNDRPAERATLHLTISTPPGVKVAASGQLTSTRANEGQNVTEWQLDSPAEPSWFGFALGSFTENTSDADGVKLRVLGAGTAIFDPTSGAIGYLTQRSGKHYPGPTYTQVFVHGEVSRSMAAGLTLLPESYAQTLGKQPDDLWLLASELAHQWYGVGVATKDWSDLWISDGVSAFLADEFLGQRYGKERLGREIESSRQIYNRIRAEGKDRSLSSADWTTRQEADGEIPVHKGAWFLYQVNQLVGDAAFAEGMRLYTTGQWGQSATSENLQKAFDAVNSVKSSAAQEAKNSRKSKVKNGETPLDNLFDLWVYGMLVTKSK